MTVEQPGSEAAGDGRAHQEDAEASLASDARAALARARDRLLSLQHEQGWWQGELETNVTMDAEDLLFREFLGIRDEERTAAAARWIRSQQRGDGTWAVYYGGPEDLSTTVKAYVALRLAGDPPGAPHMSRAAQWIRSQGGLRRRSASHAAICSARTYM
jgi:squalene-hopene/tetraprenyl-beta-curcumene cyclase